MYANLVKANKEGRVTFKDVATFNLDEYIGLEGTHNQSYRYFMNDNLFNHIDTLISMSGSTLDLDETNSELIALRKQISDKKQEELLPITKSPSA